jgi:porphobilinogen synthase
MPPRTDRFAGPRLRRLRRSATVREWLAETRPETGSLLYPLFVRPGDGPAEPVPSLPGVSRYSVAEAVDVATRGWEEGLRAVLLFGLPRRKDARGSEAASAASAVAQTVRAVKRKRPEMIVATDVCLCSYTTSGHCGVVHEGSVDNDVTLPLLARMALAHARAGADLVAPSAMMDHQVAAIRAALDDDGRTETGILAYAAKFASAFYGPFREAADSTPAFGDRRGYQMDPRNGREALREMELDLAEGADILMVKPALPCLDILARARERFDAPLAAYQVSGEYALIKAAAERGWVDERAVVEESLTALHRAGAGLVVTYFAREIARWRREVA